MQFWLDVSLDIVVHTRCRDVYNSRTHITPSIAIVNFWSHNHPIENMCPVVQYEITARNDAIMILSPNFDACIVHNMHIVTYNIIIMNINQNFIHALFTIHACWDVIAKLGKTGFNKCHFDT